VEDFGIEDVRTIGTGVYRYAQHCPVARAAEVLCEPWTLLVLRELLRGRERRDEIARNLPGMSMRLLATRLRTLKAHGLVVELPGRRQEARYRLTDAGRGLEGVVDQLGRWGQRWLAPPPLRDLDVEVLLLDICGQANNRLPDTPLTVSITVTDAPGTSHWWLTLSPTGSSVHRGTSEARPDVRLLSTLRGLGAVWLGEQSWSEAVRAQTVVFAGPQSSVRSVVSCLGVSKYADVPTVVSVVERT
jgi:DNA-binding HxlR family transcriptional regulator